MAWESSPWMIGNGVEHTVEVARLLAHAGTGGAEGIVTPGDCKVEPLNVPGTKVRVAPGAVLLKNRYPGGGQQTYVGRNTSQHEVSVTATGSGGGRSDLVVARVLDPQYEGQEPADPNDFDYMRTEIIEDVPSSTKRFDELGLNYPAVALARIDLPASTGTVQAQHVTDLRVMAQPRRSEVVFGRPRVTEDSGTQDWLKARAATGGEYFPGGAGYANQIEIDIPIWANRMLIDADWMSVIYVAGKDVYGTYWIEWGDEYRPHTWPDGQQWEFASQKFSFDSTNSGNTYRTNWRLMDNRWIDPKLRGRRATFVFKAALADNTNAVTDGCKMDYLSGLGLRLTFAETAGTWEDVI